MNQSSSSQIIYKTQRATSEQIYLHLIACNNYFIPPLEQKVNLRNYADKLFEKSKTFEAWTNDTVIGLLAAYLDNPKSGFGFITNVSIDQQYAGKGIASVLLHECLVYAREKDFSEIRLEVNASNLPAIKLYEKAGFEIFDQINDSIQMKVKIDNNVNE